MLRSYRSNWTFRQSELPEQSGLKNSLTLIRSIEGFAITYGEFGRAKRAEASTKPGPNSDSSRLVEELV